MQLMDVCRNVHWWANTAGHTHHCLVSYIWVCWQMVIGRKTILANHGHACLAWWNFFHQFSSGRLVFVTAPSPLIDSMKSETKLLFLSGELVADAPGFAWCRGIQSRRRRWISGLLLRRVLIAARVVLKLQRTLSFTLKVFISGASELPWTLEWQHDMHWDSSQRAFCSQMQTFSQTHDLLFYLCEHSVIGQLWPWLDHLGGRLHLIASVDPGPRLTPFTRRRYTSPCSLHFFLPTL